MIVTSSGVYLTDIRWRETLCHQGVVAKIISEGAQTVPLPCGDGAAVCEFGMKDALQNLKEGWSVVGAGFV